MRLQLSELRKIFEREEIEPGVLVAREIRNGACCTLINELLGEPLSLALFVECLNSRTSQKWSYSLKEPLVEKDENGRSNKKRLDGFVYTKELGGQLPMTIACEVKGWSDHCVGGYSTPKKPRKNSVNRTRGQYYWECLEEGFDPKKERQLCKLDAKWVAPIGLDLSENDVAVGLAMYHLMEPPQTAANVVKPLSGVDSVFWYSPPTHDRPQCVAHQRFLIFSVAKYLRDERELDFLDLDDEVVNYKVEALRRIGVFG